MATEGAGQAAARPDLVRHRHRLSTLRNADQVLVLVDGEIVERGCHDDLLARRGAYYELYMKQFRREETALA